MGHKFYFWMLLVIFLSLGILIQVEQANAMVASEIEPGIVELNTTNVYGFEVKEVLERKVKGKEWIYFCVDEKVSKKPHSKCFYGLKQDFREVKEGMILNGIQYGLKQRIYNGKGYISLKKNAYFYPVLVLNPQT